MGRKNIKFIRCTLLILVLFISSFVFAQKFEDKVIPPLNKKIIEYVDQVKGKKVNRGECWDLLNRSLEYSGAEWKPPFVYGEEINPEKDIVYPGDMIQLYNVKATTLDGTEWSFTQHSAIIYNVIERGVYEIAHQNVDNIKKVMISNLDLSTIKKGKIKFYRPVK